MEGVFLMHTFLDEAMMRDIIMDHYQNPHNLFDHSNDEDYITIHMDSASCIDDIYVHVKFHDDLIEDISWHFSACCAISRASTSILTDLVKGKPIKEALNIIENFNLMLEEKEYDFDLLQEANCFINTYKQPSRIGCATIGYRGLSKAIREMQDERE